MPAQYLERPLDDGLLGLNEFEFILHLLVLGGLLAQLIGVLFELIFGFVARPTFLLEGFFLLLHVPLNLSEVLLGLLEVLQDAFLFLGDEGSLLLVDGEFVIFGFGFTSQLVLHLID